MDNFFINICQTYKNIFLIMEKSTAFGAQLITEDAAALASQILGLKKVAAANRNNMSNGKP